MNLDLLEMMAMTIIFPIDLGNPITKFEGRITGYNSKIKSIVLLTHK